MSTFNVTVVYLLTLILMVLLGMGRLAAVGAFILLVALLIKWVLDFLPQSARQVVYIFAVIGGFVFWGVVLSS